MSEGLWICPDCGHRVDHPRFTRIEEYGPRSYGHQFRFGSPDDIDAELQAFVGEACLGLREHLHGRREGRERRLPR